MEASASADTPVSNLDSAAEALRRSNSFAVLGSPSPSLSPPVAGALSGSARGLSPCEPPATSISELLRGQQTLPAPVPPPIAADCKVDDYFTTVRAPDPIPCAVDTTIPMTSPPAAVKAGHRLRLPSFDLLGIAAPHPDRLSLNPEASLYPPDLTAGSETLGGGPPSSLPKLSEPAHEEGSLPAPLHHEYAERMLRYSCNLYPLTPPDEAGAITPTVVPKAPSDAMHTPLIMLDGLHGAEGASQNAGATVSSAAIPHREAREELTTWVKEVVDLVVSTFSCDNLESYSYKILSHALPCPGTPGHAFPTIIQALDQRIPPTPTTWINVFHAVHGRFNLEDLPTSPPNTPGPAFGGLDYFATKIFDTAVPISDYSMENTPVTSSPRLVVPPSTINIAIVERYIPPTSSHEFAGLFDPRGPSLLVDRLVELSPHDGHLVFVYPTKTGARTFMRDYLGPILDPLLRSMVVVNGFSSDLSATLGRMAAVDDLPEFADMERNINVLCRHLGQDRIQRYSGKTSFTVIHAVKQEVHLDRGHWGTWYVKQEKPKIRAVVGKYFRLAKKLPADADVLPHNLIQEIIDGVLSRPYPANLAPTRGIEFGAFVIRRSLPR